MPRPTPPAAPANPSFSQCLRHDVAYAAGVAALAAQQLGAACRLQATYELASSSGGSRLFMLGEATSRAVGFAAFLRASSRADAAQAQLRTATPSGRPPRLAAILRGLLLGELAASALLAACALKRGNATFLLLAHNTASGLVAAESVGAWHLLRAHAALPATQRYLAAQPSNASTWEMGCQTLAFVLLSTPLHAALKACLQHAGGAAALNQTHLAIYAGALGGLLGAAAQGLLLTPLLRRAEALAQRHRPAST